jgi:hypothetical protein
MAMTALIDVPIVLVITLPVDDGGTSYPSFQRSKSWGVERGTGHRRRLSHCPSPRGTATGQR